MEKKQSSVEWLISELIYKSEFQDLPNDYYLMSDKDIDKIIEQAKQMEKEQNIGLLIWMNEISKSEPMRLETDFDDIVEQYYNETFGNEINKAI